MGINWGHAPIGFFFSPPKGEIYGLEISFFVCGRASEVDRLCWERKSLNPEAPAERAGNAKSLDFANFFGNEMSSFFRIRFLQSLIGD